MATEQITNNETRNNECYIVPVTDIYESDNDYILKLEVPGIVKENVEITLDNNELEIRGHHGEDEEKEAIYSEFTLYDYYRKFKVGDDIDRDKIDAKLENGILTLVLNKSEKVKPKKIEISVN